MSVDAAKGTHTLVLVRHGESVWNQSGKFTGWTDVDLSRWGIREAQRAGRLLKKENFVFDRVFTSVLKRAIRTTWIVLDEMDLMYIPVHTAWELNERHYGALQGLDKEETIKKYGESQVKEWRRGYATRPPPLPVNDPRLPEFDPKYAKIPAEKLPDAESLADTLQRVLPFWDDRIEPAVRGGETVLVSAHGNSLRALVKYLDSVPDDTITGLNIPTGFPLVYELDDSLHPVRHYYLGRPGDVQRAIDRAKQGGVLK